jgi:hypothetical protein
MAQGDVRARDHFRETDGHGRDPAHAVAQDIQTRVVVLPAATDLGKVEVHFNGDEALDEFKYGDLSDRIDLDPHTVQVWITRDRAGINYTVFNAVYPAPAGTADVVARPGPAPPNTSFGP